MKKSMMWMLAAGFIVSCGFVTGCKKSNEEKADEAVEQVQDVFEWSSDWQAAAPNFLEFRDNFVTGFFITFPQSMREELLRQGLDPENSEILVSAATERMEKILRPTINQYSPQEFVLMGMEQGEEFDEFLVKLSPW
jgi:outer membrane lipoprotein-sorting protein